MSAAFTRRLLPVSLGLGLGAAGLSTPFLFKSQSTYLHCQSRSTWATEDTSIRTWLFNTLNPFRKQLPPQPPPPPPVERPTAIKATFNPIYYRQISTGSFLGLVSGWVVAKWGRVLVLVVGVIFFLVEFLELNGIYVIPYGRIQRFISDNGEDLRRRMMVPEYIAFKIAFSAAFSMAAIQSY